MALTSIPTFFVIQSSASSLYLSPNTTEKRPSGVLKFSEASIFSPRVKFAAEQSKKGGDTTVVHIRSCFNNKYWVPHEVSKGVFEVGASANKPQEDTTDPACTLFRVSIHSDPDGTSGFRFFHISTSVYALNISGGLGMLTDPPSYSTFPAVDWETLVILPDQVAFRSEHLGRNLLRSRVISGNNHISFESGSDIGDPEVGYELIPASRGNYRIKSLAYGKLLKRISPDWLVAHAEVEDNSNDTLFSFIKVSDNVFALSYVGNQRFCGGLGASNCLSASYSELSKETRLIVEERVVQKKISNVRYRLDHSVIYDEQVQEVVTEFATNNSPDKENTTTLEFSQTESITATWNNSQSSTTGASMSVGFEVDEVPFVASMTMEVSLSTEYGSSHEWGQENTKAHESKASYTVAVPPLTTMKLSLMVSKGACDVPFDYTETVLLLNGKWATREKDDGIYKGLNTLKFQFHSSKVDYQAGLGQVIGDQ
ncbi:putative aerolysin, Agglutinin domain, Agglutinin domain superfamily [Helianthus annuus]|nr:putative aerolysin, Agglutinin domain, Agglutinin domain superfamily [Helianthus annuus]